MQICCLPYPANGCIRRFPFHIPPGNVFEPEPKSPSIMLSFTELRVAVADNKLANKYHP